MKFYLKPKIFIPLLICVALLLNGCTNPTNESNLEDESYDMNNINIVANNMADLRAVSNISDQSIVLLKGYYSPNDGGGGMFFWSPSSSVEDNGGTIIKLNNLEKGRLYRIHEENLLNVKWFGARGVGTGDDHKAIQAAIDSLPLQGGTVSIPGGNYPVSKPLVIGNGDGGETFSTRNGVKLIGEGGGFATWTNIPTQLIATEKIDTIIDVRGRTSDCYIKSMYINGNQKAKNGLTMKAVSGCIIANLKIIQFTEKGLVILGGEAPTGNYNVSNRFESLNVVTTVDNTTCLYIDGDYSATNDTWLTTFIDSRFDTHTTANSIAAHFKFVDSISFYRCHFAKYNEESKCVVFDALDNNDFPCGMAFYDCSVGDTEVLEDENNKIRKNYFYGYGTYDNEVVPTHNKLIGITDEGIPFNMPALGGEVSEGKELPAMTGIFDTYSNAEYSWINLNEEEAEVAIRFNAGSNLKRGWFYLPSFDDDTGTVNISIYEWEEDYNNTISGEALYQTSFIDFVDNSWQSFTIPDPLPKGEYLVVLHDCTDTGFGVGVWLKGKGSGIITYQNGAIADFGIVAQFEVN